MSRIEDVLSGKARWAIECGDALTGLPMLPDGCVDAVVTDPPFGMDWNTDSTRFTGGKGYHNKRTRRIAGDNEPFDPTPFLAFPKVVLWGSNHYANRLPLGTTLVWLKKSVTKLGKVLSDCEVGWYSQGHGVYLFPHVWDGCARESENQEHFHPTQKPVALMKWILERMDLPDDAVVFDPYCGSGSTGVAALLMGYRFLGYEIDSAYHRIAMDRLSECDQIPPLIAAANRTLFEDQDHDD